MKSRRSSLVPFTLLVASTMLACSCSTGPKLTPQALEASIPSRLLVHPQNPPKVQRSTDPATGKPGMTGGDAVTSMTDLYDYIGSVKGQLDSLIDAVVARDAPPPPKKRRGLHL